MFIWVETHDQLGDFPFGANSYGTPMRHGSKANASPDTSFWPSWSLLADMKSCGDDWWNETLFIPWFRICMYDCMCMWERDVMWIHATQFKEEWVCFFVKTFTMDSNIMHTFLKYIEMYQYTETFNM